MPLGFIGNLGIGEIIVLVLIGLTLLVGVGLVLRLTNRRK